RRASGHRKAATGELALEIELGRSRGDPSRHRPEDLELEPVRVLGVERQAHAVIRRPDQRPGVDESLTRPRQVGEVIDLPGGVIHARDPLVGARHAGLLEQAEVVIVRRSRDLQERGGRIATLDLEAHDVAVEAHAALDVRHPENQVLQPLEPRAGLRHAHREASWGYSTLTVMAAQAMSVSEVGERSPPLTAWTVTSPCGSSRRTTSSLTESGSGPPMVTSTSIRPPRSRTSWKSGRLECRIASDTARQAAFVESRPYTSTPIPNSSTHGFALTVLPPSPIRSFPSGSRRRTARSHRRWRGPCGLAPAEHRAALDRPSPVRAAAASSRR